MKDISLTPFNKVNLTEGLFIGTKLDVEQILTSILPGEEFTNVILVSFASNFCLCHYFLLLSFL